MPPTSSCRRSEVGDERHARERAPRASLTQPPPRSARPAWVGGSRSAAIDCRHLCADHVDHVDRGYGSEKEGQRFFPT